MTQPQTDPSSGSSAKHVTFLRRVGATLYFKVLPYTRPDDLCVLIFALTVIILFFVAQLPFQWIVFWVFIKPLFYWLALLASLFVLFLTETHYDIRKSTGRIVGGATRLLRDFIPYLICLVIYLNLADVVHLVNPNDKDLLLIRIDDALFGVQLSQWMEQFSSLWLDEWMHFTYEIFGLYPVTLGLFFFGRGQRRAFRDLLLAIILASYIGYLGYMLVPAVGPRYTLDFRVDLRGRFFAVVEWAMNDTMRIPRDCFPSLHTANTLVVLGMAWRYRRKLFWWYLPLGISTVVATVYLRYHYMIDVIAGAFLALAVVKLAPWWNDRWDAWTARIRRDTPHGQR